METDPVIDESFFGRKEILERVNKRFDAFERGYRQNIGLIGRPFIGKSSVLAQFLRSQSFKQTIPIFIRIEEAETFPFFLQKWLAGILYGYQRFLGLPPSTDLRGLIRQMRRRLPRLMKAMRVVRKLAETKQCDASYRQMLHLLSVLHEETGKKILLVIDEFDRLAHLPVSDPFALLGKEIMVQKETMYVVSSSTPERAHEVFREKLSLLFSNFEVIELKHLDFQEAEAWIDALLGKKFLNGFLRRMLLRLTNSHPYYLDVLLRRFQSLLALNSGIEVTQPVFIECLEKELFDHRGTLSQHFLMQIFAVTRSRSCYSHGDVLLALALGKKKVFQITKFLKKPSEEIKKIIQRLIQEQLIAKHGSFYDVTDSLFRFWLAEVYYRKRALFDLNVQFSRNEFRASVERWLEVLEKEDRKDLPLRIEELFRKFGNDVIVLDEKKMKCPHFTEVISKPSNGRVFPVIARNLNTRWMCQVVKERLKEDDIHLFLDDLRRLRNQVHKKLVIALHGVDLNAKLLAQESKIQLWDLRELNQILDLYGQPKVIL